MRRARLLLASLLLVPIVFAGEIFKLKGDPIKGDIVSVTEKEVVYEQGGKRIKLPIEGVLKIDYQEVDKKDLPPTYAQVELTDGTTVRVNKWSIVKRDLTMTLVSGPTVTVPLKHVANVLNNAHEEKNQTDWKGRTFNTRGREAVVRQREGIIANIDATIGEGDAKGEKIKAAVDIGGGMIETNEFTLEKVHGLIFKHVLDPKAPAIRCKLLDTKGNLVIVSGLTAREGGLEVTTPSGAKLTFAKDQLAQLDYTKGKLDFLSAMTPTKVVAKANLDENPNSDQWHVYKDTNLNKGPLSLGGVTYSKGLAIKPYTEILYDIKGDYRELSFLVGIDDNVSADGKTILIIECDGKEREPIEISSTDKKRFKPVTMNIKDVQKLKIIVKADGDFDVARHLDLADAKVSK